MIGLPKSGATRRWVALALIAAATLLGTASPHAQERIRFDAINLTTIADVMGDTTTPDTVQVTGVLTMPAGAAGPVPAMIIVPDATGLDDGGRVAYWSQFLNDMGVATFVIESFRSRGHEKSQAGQRIVTPDMQIADAFAALEVLAADPRIDGRRIGIMGSGAGGSVAVHTAFNQLHRTLGKGRHKFAVHIGLYPACDAQWQLLDPTDGPIHFILAGEGRLHLAERCENYAKRIGTAGGKVTTAVFPRAFYGFDSEWDRTNVGGLSSLNKCFFRITDKGVLVEVNGKLSTDTLEGRNAIAKQCTSFGALVSGNAGIRDAAAEKVREYVNTALLR